MDKVLNSIKEFILSLENERLNGEQQSCLFEGKDSLFGQGSNYMCTNQQCTNSEPDCVKEDNMISWILTY